MTPAPNSPTVEAGGGVTSPLRAVPEHMSFGWGAPKISEQFEGCGLSFDELQHFDRDSEAVSCLSVRGMIPRAQAEAAYRRIQKRFESDLIKARAAISSALDPTGSAGGAKHG